MRKSIFEELDAIYEEEQKENEKENSHKMTLKDAIDILVKTYKGNNVGYGSVYIMPDGTFLNLGDSGYGHSNISYFLNENGLEIDYQPSKASKRLRNLGWIRVNTKVKFIEMPNFMYNESQEEPLKEAIRFMGNDVQIAINDDRKIYQNVDTDYIIGRIKKYYQFGRFFESYKKK